MNDQIRTARLLLRRWTDDDRAPFAAMNADAEVMRHLPALLTRAQSDALIDRIEAGFDEHGYGLWAVEARDQLVGFTGLAWTGLDVSFTPALEVGWRLVRSAWGRGYATEAGTAALARGFDEVDNIVSFTAVTNTPSERVMQRLGMRRDGEFDHPRLPVGHRLRRHVLYRAERATWQPAGFPT